MTAQIVAFRGYRRFDTIVAAIEWSDANRVHQHFWMTFDKPIVDSTQIPAVDEWLAAIVIQIMDMRREINPRASRLAALRKLEEAADRAAREHERRGSPDEILAAGEQLLVQGVLRLWIAQMALAHAAAQATTGGAA